MVSLLIYNAGSTLSATISTVVLVLGTWDHRLNMYYDIQYYNVLVYLYPSTSTSKSVCIDGGMVGARSLLSTTSTPTLYLFCLYTTIHTNILLLGVWDM